DCEESEECRELDHRVHGHRGCVFERIANSVSDHSSVVKWCALLFQLNLDHLLRIVPGASRIGHEYFLEEAKTGYRNQIADEEEGFNESKGQCGEEDRQKNIESALLGILCADLHNPLAVAYRGLFYPFELDVGLDELDGPVCARGNSLNRCPGKP